MNRPPGVTREGLPAEETAPPAVTAPTTGERPAGQPYAAQRAFLDDLRASGIEVSLTDAGGLRVKPWPKVEEADRARLRSEKEQIVELLGADVEVIPPPKKQPVKAKLVAGARPRKPTHRGEPRPTLERPFSARGMDTLRARQLLTIENRERGRDIATMLAAARERLGRD